MTDDKNKQTNNATETEKRYCRQKESVAIPTE